jgi:hypothetical protein
MRPHGRAAINAHNPEALGICDRCGFRHNHKQFDWQYEWAGPRLVNLRQLVCPSCYDVPQEQLRTIILPPDPVPIAYPRPEFYTSDNNPITTIGMGAADLISPLIGNDGGWTVGSLTQYGGLRRAFDGLNSKPFVWSAALNQSSTAALSNTVGRSWTAVAGITTGLPATQLNPSLPLGNPAVNQAGQSLMTQEFVIVQAQIWAPSNMPFLESGPAAIALQGSSDGVHWTNLFTGTTEGAIGEVFAITSSQITSATYYPYHQVAFTGDGTAIGVGQLQLWSAGGSLAGANDLSQG